MSNLNNFFAGCGIPQYVWINAQEDSKIEPAEMAEYSAIEQAVSIWWLSNNKPLYWKIEQLQAGFEKLNIEKFFKSMLERHPQMNPSFHDIQLDLSEDGQAAPSSDPPTPITLLWNMQKSKFQRGKGIPFNCYQALSTNLNL